MDRRNFARLAAAGLFGASLAALAQPAGRVWRIGFLNGGTRPPDGAPPVALRKALQALGYTEGKDIAYEGRWAEVRNERLQGLAAELVARKPELIYAPPAQAALAAKQATQTIPIVFGQVANPVSLGLVMDLAHPGGNVTGISSNFERLGLKRAELFLQILPRAKRFGFLSDPGRMSMDDAVAFAAGLDALGLSLIVAEAANPAELEAAVARLADHRVDGILVHAIIANNLRARVIELANARRLPVIGANAQMADAGALFSYGASLAARLRRSAQMVDKVLKGAKPADLPVEQPTLFELVLNLKTAKALGITIPQSILLRADRVIE